MLVRSRALAAVGQLDQVAYYVSVSLFVCLLKSFVAFFSSSVHRLLNMCKKRWLTIPTIQRCSDYSRLICVHSFVIVVVQV